MTVAVTTGTPVPILPERLNELYSAAQAFIPRDRGEALIRKWVARPGAEQGMSDFRMMSMMADAVLLAADLLVSQPSSSGSTAFDRLARSRGRMSVEDRAAIAALSQARFRVLYIKRTEPNGDLIVLDGMSGEDLRIEDADVPPLQYGLPIFARLAMTGNKTGCLIGTITPLNTEALDLAQGHLMAKARGAPQNARWAEAVYAHVVRHGTLDIPGLNRPAADADGGMLFEDIDQDLLDLVRGWAELVGAEPDPDLLLATRQAADLARILDTLDGAILAEDAQDEAMAAAFQRVLAVQLETVALRERGGSTSLTLDSIAATIDEAIAQRGWPPRARTLFERLSPGRAGGQTPDDPSLDRLVQRIQALRAKTVAQGCTEQEAMAAAEKVAELLDRYGLSLSELELKAQPCEGIGVQTTRRRMAPIDECIPAVATFCDCRVWAERAVGAPLRYIYFGLRSDVAGAHYLHEMVERVFETETTLFRKSALYKEMANGRRGATNSFQIGLARGITAKLHRIRAARDEAMLSASGRDLVPVKAAVVDAEIEKLGLRLNRRAIGGGKRVYKDAFAAGREAGERFEFADALPNSGCSKSGAAGRR